MLLRLALQYAEQLPPVVRQELEQLIAAIQQQSTNLIPTVNIPVIPIEKVPMTEVKEIIFAVLTADPTAPDDNSWWVLKEGTSPTTVTLRVRINNTNYSLAAIEI